MRARFVWMMVCIMVVAVAGMACATGDREYDLQVRAGVRTSNGTHPTMGVDWWNSTHNNRLINYASADWLGINGANAFMATVGHRWTSGRAGLFAGPGVYYGTVNVNESECRKKEEVGTRAGWKAGVDYALSDNVALSASYFKNGIHAHGPTGCGFLLQLGYRW